MDYLIQRIDSPHRIITLNQSKIPLFYFSDGYLVNNQEGCGHLVYLYERESARASCKLNPHQTLPAFISSDNKGVSLALCSALVF